MDAGLRVTQWSDISIPTVDPTSSQDPESRHLANPSLIDRVLDRAGIVTPLERRAPSPQRFVVAAIIAMGASVALTTVIAKFGVRIFPAVRHYSHLRLFDYAGLTIMGVSAACAAWLAVSQLTTSPRRLFLRLAVVVTTVLLVPDLALLLLKVAPRAVLILVCMHLAVAIVTYNVLVRVAPPRRGAGPSTHREEALGGDIGVAPPDERVVPSLALKRSTWVTMSWSVLAEMLSGFGFLLFVPLEHPTGWIMEHGFVASLVHATLGAVLAVGSVAIFLFSRRGPRIERIAGATGVTGIVVAALGGALCYEHSWRLVGGVFMFLGVSVALFGYVMPLIGENPGTPPHRRGPATAPVADR